MRSELLILMDFTTVISNTQVDIKSYVIELKNIGSGRAQNLKGEVMYYFEKENPVQEKIHALDDIGTIFPDKAEVISVSYPFDCHSITKISCIIHYEDGGGSWQSKRDYKVVTPYKNEKKLLVTQKRGAFTMCDANEYYFESLTKTIYDKIEIRRFKWRNIKK